MNLESDYIYSYTRKQAIEDGVLLDVTDLAKDAGFKVPVAVTIGLYSGYLKTDISGQDETGRLWDVVSVFALYARGTRESCIYFNVIFTMADEDENITLKAVIGPGDEGEPVITIMLQNES